MTALCNMHYFILAMAVILEFFYTKPFDNILA